MKVILVKDIEKVGKEGSLVEVKNGFARNYLLTQGLAIKATKDSTQRFEHIKRQRAKQLETEIKRAAALKEKIEAISITIPASVKEESEEIYGSITETHILKALKDENIILEKHMVTLPEPIKKLGGHTISISIHQKIEAHLRLWVVKK